MFDQRWRKQAWGLFAVASCTATANTSQRVLVAFSITYPLVWQLKRVVSNIHAPTDPHKKCGAHIHRWTPPEKVGGQLTPWLRGPCVRAWCDTKLALVTFTNFAAACSLFQNQCDLLTVWIVTGSLKVMKSFEVERCILLSPGSSLCVFVVKMLSNRAVNCQVCLWVASNCVPHFLNKCSVATVE